MLRKVSEDDIIQRSAEDMASKRSDEDMELYKARLREELRVEAEANAEKKFEVKRKSIEDRERLVELKEHGLQLKTDAVNAAVKELSADKTQFDEQKEQVNYLRLYMEENHLDNSNMFGTPLFFNNKHEKLTREGVAYVLKAYADMTRKVNPSLIPDRLSCHSIRHSKAMHLLQSGVHLVYIRDILGHVSIQTTDIYARADSKAKREALEKAYVDLNPEVESDRAWEHDENLWEWLKGFNH